jgi:DNA polymerase-1
MIVDSYETMQLASEFINGNELLAYDTETTGLNVRKDKVIGFGFSNGLSGFYVPIYWWTGKTLAPVCPDALYNPILQALRAKNLLMFNASFDARITKQSLGVDLLASLHTDVLLLKHTVDEEFPFDLKNIATKLFGDDATAEKKIMQESIKANGGTAKEYYKADMQTIAEYCIKDCLLTFRVYNYYLSKLKTEGLEKFYYEDEVLPLYKEVTIPMESNGIKLDIPLMLATKENITNDMAKLESEIQSSIEPALDIFTGWFLNKDYPLQTPKGKAPVWTRKHSTQYDAWKADNPNSYMFNLLSKHHLKKLFFDTLHEKPLNKTPTGQPQVDEEFLDVMATKYDWAQKLIDYNKLTKIKSTYIDRFLEEAEDGYFYPSFYQHRTTSGRYGSDMQQLPRPVEGDSAVARYTTLIRSFFIADAGNVLISADYNQLEPSVFAHVSGDPALQEIFTTGKDFYSEIAIRTERLVGVSSDKKAPNYLGKVNKLKRQSAKAYSLGIPYGLTGYKLKFELGVEQNEADQLIKDYLQAFPKLAQWMDKSKDEANFNGCVRSQAGRIRHLQRARELFSRYGARIADSLQLWKDFHADNIAYMQAKEDHREYKNLCNNAKNFQIQSLAASIVNQASIKIARVFKAFGMSAKIINSVHDEIQVECPESELEVVSEILKYNMETIVELAVPLVTEPQSGRSMLEIK